MKEYALSIRQPWAWLIVNGHKDIENRSWKTTFRGRFFVHAGQAFDTEALDMLTALGMAAEYDMPIMPEQYQTGGIVGTAEIVDCVSASDSVWFEGDFGFAIQNAALVEFRPYKGRLGFFTLN